MPVFKHEIFFKDYGKMPYTSEFLSPAVYLLVL